MQLKSGPGGRHNNDFEDYRSIKLIPTIQELECKTSAYLPTAKSMEEKKNSMTPQAALLDRQFRLLREDLLLQLKEQLEDMKNPNSRYIQFSDIKIEGFFLPNFAPTYREYPSFVIVSFRLPAWNKLNKMKEWEEREAFWENAKLLRENMMVIFMRNGAPVPVSREFCTLRTWKFPMQ